MPQYLFEQQPVTEFDSDQPRLAFNANDNLFTAMPSKDEMASHWGINSIDTRKLGTLKLLFHTGMEDQQLDDELVKLGAFAANDPFVISRFMGPGVFYTGLAWAVECAAPNCVNFNIQVVRCSDNEVIHEIEDVSASAGSTFNGEKFDGVPPFIGSGEAYLLRLVFNELPYEDADGNKMWGNQCNPVPCMGIRVHALVEDSCLAVYNTGCGVSGPCCAATPSYTCDTPTLVKTC